MRIAKQNRHSERCPRCQFSYAWDGRFCDHCHYPHPKRTNWDEFQQLARFPYAHPDPEPRKLRLFGCACLRQTGCALPPPAAAILNTLEHASTADEGRRAVIQVEHVYTSLPDGPSTTRDLVRLLAILAQMLGGPAPSDSPIAYLLEPATPALLVGMTRPNELRQLMFQFAHQCAQMQAHLRTPRHPSEGIDQPDFIAELVRQFGYAAPDNIERLAATGMVPYLRAEQIDEAVRFSQARRLAHELSQQRRQTVVELEAQQCDLYRDLFGYPYVTVEFPLAYRTSTVYSLAQSMYEAADFSAMPILGDALMDAGCEDGEIIAHCRRPLAHARGCWLIERILKGSETSAGRDAGQ